MRYAIFTMDNYYPIGGWEDFRSAHATLEEAEAALIGYGPKRPFSGPDWWQIVDLRDCKQIREGNWKDDQVKKQLFYSHKMAHIIFNTSEKKALENADLPDGTTLVQCREDKYGTPMYRFLIEKSEWIVTKDFVECNRGWKKGEQEEFEADMSRERVIDFFMNHKDDSPQREYSSMSKAAYKHLKFISHSGTYGPDDETGEYRAAFSIWLNTDSDLDAAEEEITWVFKKVAKAYPKWNPIYIGIFEHTLSEHGTYSVNWNRGKQFHLTKCWYGHEQEIAKFTSWRSLLEYVSKHHYYEDPSSSSEEDWY